MEGIATVTQEGYLRRRILPDSPGTLYLGLKQPSRHRIFLLVVSRAGAQVLVRPPETRGVQLRILPGPSTGETTLELELINQAYLSIFSALVADIGSYVGSSANESKAVEALISRFTAWQRFLEQVGPYGLGREAQQGLYGELWFLDKYLLSSLPEDSAVAAWTGPTGTAQDFQLPGCAIEVKTTITKAPELLSIASERQLDETGIDALFLFHLSLDARRDGRRSLVDAVEDIRTRLDGHEIAASMFEQSLLMTGYIDLHRDSYQEIGYTERTSHIFGVMAGFPRIVEANLPSGVGNVQYTVALAACIPFLLEPTAIISKITPEKIYESE